MAAAVVVPDAATQRLLRSCLEFDGAARGTASELISAPWFDFVKRALGRLIEVSRDDVVHRIWSHYN